MTCKVHLQKMHESVPIVPKFCVNIDYIVMLLQQPNTATKYFTECVRSVFFHYILYILKTMLYFTKYVVNISHFVIN